MPAMDATDLWIEANEPSLSVFEDDGDNTESSSGVELPPMPPPLILHPSWRLYAAISSTDSDYRTYGLNPGVKIRELERRASVDVFVPRLVDLLNGRATDDLHLNDAFNILVIPSVRIPLECLLLGGEVDTNIAQVLRMNDMVVYAYRTVLFDLSAMHGIDIRAYLEHGTTSADYLSKKDVILSGLNQYKIRNGLAPKTIEVTDLVKDGILRAYERLFERSKETSSLDEENVAIKWLKTLPTLATTLKKISDEHTTSVADLAVTFGKIPSKYASMEQLITPSSGPGETNELY